MAIMKWPPAPLIKVYEALGSIGDGRFEVSGNTAKVYSSSGNKYYDVEYDPDTQTITANDNGSYWVGYLGYPSIVLLLALGVVKYDSKLAEYLKGFAWKDINQKFRNDFDKTQAYIDEQLVQKYSLDLNEFHAALQKIQAAVNALNLNKLESGKKPPEGY
jgi:hypothetical protein